MVTLGSAAARRVTATWTGSFGVSGRKPFVVKEISNSGTASRDKSARLAEARAREVLGGAFEVMLSAGAAPKVTLTPGVETLLTVAAAGEGMSSSSVQHGIVL
jgi:hypothetical protein